MWTVCSRRARPTAAGAHRSGWRRCARSSSGPSTRPATTGCASGMTEEERAGPAGVLAEPVVRMLVPDDVDARVRRPHPGAHPGSAPRRPGDPQGGRVPDLPPRRRRRRPRDGHHPRRPRRGVDLLHPEARAALPVARADPAEVRAHAAAAQREEVQDLQAEEPGGPADLVPGAGLPARGAGQLPCAAGVPADVEADGTDARCSPSRSSPSGSLGPTSTAPGPIFDLDKLDWLNGVYIRGLEVDDFTVAAAALPPGRRRARPGSPSLGELAPVDGGRRAHPDADRAPHRGHADLVRSVLRRRRRGRDRRRRPRRQLERRLGRRARRRRATRSACSTSTRAGCSGRRAAGRPRPSRAPCARRPVDGLGIKPKFAFGPLRTAVSGRRVSPPLFESMEILGKEATLTRLRTLRVHALTRHERPRSASPDPRRMIWGVREPTGNIAPRFAYVDRSPVTRPRHTPMGYGVIGNTGDSGSLF